MNDKLVAALQREIALAEQNLAEAIDHEGRSPNSYVLTIIRERRQELLDTLKRIEAAAGLSLIHSFTTIENSPSLLKITNEEDCKFLTTRFGENLDSASLTQSDHAFIDLLLSAMYDDICFIVRRSVPSETLDDDDIHGMLLEVEYKDGVVPPNTDAEEAQAIMREIPGCDVWFTHGNHIFMGRWAIRAFLPANLARAETVEVLGKRMLALFS